MRKVITALLAAVMFFLEICPASAAPQLPAPAGVKATAESSASIVLNWQAVRGAEKYAVYILYPGGKKYTKLGTTAKTVFTKSGLAAGAKYKFRVAAIDVVNKKSMTGVLSKSVAAATAAEDNFKKLFSSRTSGVYVSGEGVVTKLLSDDSEGDRHQRFILRLSDGQTLLVTHNIDIVARIDALKVGDTVEFSGEYVWNEQGGLVHWTHRSPDGGNVGGYLKHGGKVYQ